MTISKDIKFDFDDITIVPETISNIESRYSEIDPYAKSSDPLINNKLPLMTAPMDTVISLENHNKFIDNKIIPIHSRLYLTYGNGFNSFGIDDINEYIDFLTKTELNKNDLYFTHILIDVANGHMNKIFKSVESLKKLMPEVSIMVGNIANPKTYYEYAKTGLVDYVRVGIGGGGACTTSANTSIHYPMGSLISECYEYKVNNNFKTKIVADGGMKKNADIIKALALGSDYVMIGSIFNKALESASPTYWKGIKIPNEIVNEMYDNNFKLYKMYRGMSTKEAQRAMGKTQLKTAEGITKKQYVEYTLSKWVNNFEANLRSTMSYTESYNLNDFIGNCNMVRITDNAFKRFNK